MNTPTIRYYDLTTAIEPNIWTIGSARPCPVCGTKVDEVHLGGCDVERCSSCKGQRCSCSCGGKHDPTITFWDGEWPGTREARGKGWYSVFTNRWERCSYDRPGATEDLNRWSAYTQIGIDVLVSP